MKKFFEKNNLIKWTGLVLILTVLFSWIFKISVEGTAEFYRIGVLDFFTIGVIGVNSYAAIFTMIIVIAGFYELMKKTNFYKRMIETVSSTFKKQGDMFILITMLFFAILSALFIDTFALLFFVPFFISVILELKYDRFTAFLATFGSILVGTIGSLYNGNYVGQLVSVLGNTYKDNAIYRFGLFAVAFIMLVVFTLMQAKKSSKKELTSEIADELFVVKKPKKEKKAIGSVIIFVLLSIVVIIAAIQWGSAFNATWAASLHNWFNELTIAGEPLLKHLVGYNAEFGTWDLFNFQALILFASALIAIGSRISLSDFIDSFVEGMKKVAKPLMVIFVVFFIRTVVYYYPAIQTVFDGMMKEFNYFVAAFIGFFASIFGVDVQNTWAISGARMVSAFEPVINKNTLSVIFQSVYGLAQFVAPSSVFLMLGLSFLDIPYTTWLKKSWKLIVGLLILVIVVIGLVTQL